MTTRTPTGRAIEVPDLVGDKADQAIQRLRELGLMPVTWSVDVDDVNDAGFVLGLDPPAGSPVRPKSAVTMSVATHPDFQGHADDGLATESDELVQPPLTWPLSGPTGFVPADPAPLPEAVTEAVPTAATAGARSAPASPPIDAASRELRQPDAAASSAGQPTPGVAADPYPQDFSAPVPTPEEISADAEWDRLRAAEAARHAADRPSSGDLASPPAAVAPVVDVTQQAAGAPVVEAAAHDSADALEEQARRDARRRRARRRRHLTLKQKAIVATVLAFTVLIGVSAMSGHKPVAHAANSARAAAHQGSRPGHTASAPATVHHKRAKTAGPAHHKRAKATAARVHHKRVRSHRRHLDGARRRPHARVRTVTVPVTAPSTTSTNSTSPSAPASSGFSTTTPANTGAGTTTTPAASTQPTPSHQPASTASGSGSSGTGGGSTLQSPGGANAPPQP